MQFQLSIFSPKQHIGSKQLELANHCFDLWAKEWSTIYNNVGSSQSFNESDFYRQDHFAVIHRNNKIAAIWAGTQFNLSQTAARRHNFMKFFNEDFMAHLEHFSTHQVMSIEYLTSSSEFRRLYAVPHLGRSMIALATRLFLESKSDCLVAAARTDVAAAKLCYEVGFECVVPNTIQRNFPCDLIACHRSQVKRNNIHESHDFIEKLWRNRNDSRVPSETHLNQHDQAKTA